MTTCFQVPIILRAMQPVVNCLYHSTGCTACVQMPVVFWWAKEFVSCGVYGGGERCAQGSGGDHLREIDHWGDPDIDGRIIL